MAQTAQRPRKVTSRTLSFIWLEITGKCQLLCGHHCYAKSGPDGKHSTMTSSDWESVIDQAARLGVELVQFIGGEPTLHPDLAHLIRYALAAGVEVEVFSNLVHVTPELWEVFSLPGVRLATSYYSDDPAQHLLVTSRNTHGRTRANIAEALRRGIRLRAGIIGVLDGQRTAQAHVDLEALGVAEIGTDQVRRIGRGGGTHDVNQLCGNCGRGIAAISPTGEVWPCVMSRWMSAGSVLQQDLADIVAGQRWKDLVASIPGLTPEAGPCSPGKPCGPDGKCNPSCYPNCSPISHCNPRNPKPPAPCKPKGGK